jgi:hypothetical protein
MCKAPINRDGENGIFKLDRREFIMGDARKRKFYRHSRSWLRRSVCCSSESTTPGIRWHTSLSPAPATMRRGLSDPARCEKVIILL